MIQHTYDALLVFTSILIASLAGFAALDLSSRVAVAAGRARLLWIAASAIAMGTGIWSMHFIAMLGLRMPIAVGYDILLVAGSLVIAILASAITFAGVAEARARLRDLALASLAMGPAIAGMHYTGMAAMHMPARIEYNGALVALSVAIAITVSFTALVLAQHFRQRERHSGWLKLATSGVMGAAVYGMHYTGMTAARFYPAPGKAVMPSDVMASDMLAWAIAVGAVVVISLALLAGLADRRTSAARARTDAIMESALDCIITMDEHGKIMDFNPAAERTFGYERRHAVGRDLAELIIPAELRAAHRAGLHHYRNTREGPVLGQRLEVPAITADGRRLDIELAITRVPVGDPPVFTGFMRDITERKRIEDALRTHAQQLQVLTEQAEQARREAEEANRAKSEFLAAMSHELRTPLNAIGGYVQLMELGLRGPVTDEQRADFRRVQQNQRLLLGLINDVLNFAKIEAGKLEIRTDSVPVSEVLDSIEAVIRPQLQAKKLNYRYLDCDRSVMAQGDRERIQQIMLNLVSNAVKFSQERGIITVGCVGRNGTIELWVHDTGRGIPLDKLDSIFEPFVQVDRVADGARDQGIGLGLAISRELARAMSGELTVQSKEGEGSRFALTLRQSDYVP